MVHRKPEDRKKSYISDTCTCLRNIVLRKEKKNSTPLSDDNNKDKSQSYNTLGTNLYFVWA